MSNLLKRLLVAAVGIPLLLSAAVYRTWPLYVIVIILQAGALWEWLRLCHANGSRPNPVGIILGLAGLDGLVFTHGAPSGQAGILIGISAMLLLGVFRSERRPLRDLAVSMLFVGYVALPLALWGVLHRPEAAARWEPIGPLALVFLATWVCDTAAFFFGRQFGRHKLDVSASPNKTVEGFVAGVGFGALVLPICSALRLAEPSGLDYVILPLIVGLAGQAGDLLESLMKREAQLKDTSAILPGHGGVLDRFDSLFLSSPLLFAYLILSPA